MSPLLFFLSISGLFCLLRAATLMLSRFYMRILHKEANTHRKVFQNQWSSSTPSEAIISIPPFPITYCDFHSFTCSASGSFLDFDVWQECVAICFDVMSFIILNVNTRVNTIWTITSFIQHPTR